MRSLSRAVFVALAIGGAAPLAAQTCLGISSFTPSRTRVGAGVQFGDHANEYGVELAGGLPNGLFASGQLGRIDASDSPVMATHGSVAVGYSVPVAHAEFCPVVGYDHAWFSKYDDGFGDMLEPSVNSYHAGGALGTSFPITATLALKPFLSAAYVHETDSFSTDDEGATITVSESSNYGLLGTGFGIVAHDKYTLQLNTNVIVGEGHNTPTMLVGFGVNF